MKSLRCVGGPADGRRFDVPDGVSEWRVIDWMVLPEALCRDNQRPPDPMPTFGEFTYRLTTLDTGEPVLVPADGGAG